MLLVRNRLSGWHLQPKEILGRPDFAFGREHIAIFVDGCFWHGCPKCNKRSSSNQSFWDEKVRRNRERDKCQRTRLRREGWRVLSIWEHELRRPVKVLRRIQVALGKRER